MTEKLKFSYLIIAILLAGFQPWRSPAAQTAPASSLENELKAHYKLTKTGTDSAGFAIVEPGTVLIIQKGGILGVPPTNPSIVSATFQNGELRSPEGQAVSGTRFLPVGEKIYITKIEANLKSDRVALMIIECDSCNGAQKPSFYKSAVVFQFPKDYLAGAAIDQIEDVISQVLPEPPRADAAPQENQAKNPASGFSNADVIKMVKAKLPDSIVIQKIKSSSGEFDTNADALIKLKDAGVSDIVIQTMLEGPPPTDSSSGGDAATVAPAAAPSQHTCGGYDDCMKIARALLESSQWGRALERFQEAAQVDPSKGDPWAGSGFAKFQMGQYDEAVEMWDRALQLGAILSTGACHAKAMCGDTGTLSLSLKEVAFVNKNGEKELASPPSEISSEGAVIFNGGQAYFLQLRIAGKNYRFYYLPKVVGCRMGFVCPEPGVTQQKVFGDYVHGALVRMAAGDLGSRPARP